MATIRQASPNDIPQVAKLSELWAAEAITHGLAPNSEEHLNALLGEYFWVAEESDGVAGYILGSIHQSEGLAVIPLGELYLEVDEVYVHPEHRSANIGHLLVDHLLQTAEHNGITRSVVYSASKQWQRMVGFYEKHGFQMWFVQMYR